MGRENYTYQEIVQNFGAERIAERYNYLKSKMNDFITDSGYKGQIECNDRILRHVVIDYFVDIDRLKEFHNIEKIKTSKITAYTANWIIRRKPLQFIHTDKDERDIFVNERFVVFFVLNELFAEDEPPVLSTKDMGVFDGYLDLVLYYLKYRECNPQVLELMIESFKMGMFVVKGDLVEGARE